MNEPRDGTSTSRVSVSDLDRYPLPEAEPDEARDVAANRLNLDADSVKDGVAQLVLTLVKFLQELLTRQAVRRMEAGTLSEEEIERIGLALLKQEEQIERLRKEFGLEAKDLNLDLGPLGKLM